MHGSEWQEGTFGRNEEKWRLHRIQSWCSLHFVSGRKRNDPTNFDYIPTQNLIPLQHCTPNQISDVSSLCGGAASDKFIVQNSGVLNPIKLGDNVMADRGFDIHLELNRNGASLKIKISVVK